MMDLSVKSLYSNFREATSSFYSSNKERSVVKLLERTAKSLETLLKGIDKFLKTKNIDVKDVYEKTKNRGKSLLDQSKKLIEANKDKGKLGTLKEAAKNISGKISDKYKAAKEKHTGPPSGTEEGKTEGLFDKLLSSVLEIKDATKGFVEAVRENSKDGEGSNKKPSWMDKAKERASKRAKEVQDEKNAVLERTKGKGKEGWLGKILSGIMSLGGFLVRGMMSSVKFLGGFLFRGFGKLLTRFVPSLSAGIARSLQSLAGNAVKGAGKLAWQGIKGAGNLAWQGIKAGARSALPTLGRAALTVGRGAAMLASGPVGWAIAIGTAIYAGYKLYKYLNRNNVSTDIYGKLTMLRLYMYGFNEVKKENFSKIFDLEMALKDYVRWGDTGIIINKVDSEFIDKVLEIFGITKDEKDKFRLLNNWFSKRFIPAYKAFMNALYFVNNKIYLDEIDKLKPDDLMRFIEKFTLPVSIFSVEEVPSFDDPKVLITKSDVETLYTNIKNDIKSKASKEKSAVVKAGEENKRNEAKKDVQNKEVQEANKQATTPTTAPTGNASPGSNGAGGKTPPPSDLEGEDKKAGNNGPTGGAAEKAEVKSAGKINMANGSLTPGSTSLEGITTKLDKSKIFNLDPNVRELFTGMAKEYNSITGKSIQVNEAFRSYEDQAALYNKMPGKAAKPGSSTHEYGLAIDINSQTSEELNKLGLLRKYGFSTSIGGEKWHIEPIGVSLNPGLAKTDKDFKTKAVLASPGRGGGGYGLEPNSVMKKRNIPLQTSIYNSGTSTPIDTTKVAEKKDSKGAADIKANAPSNLNEANKNLEGKGGTKTASAGTTPRKGGSTGTGSPAAGSSGGSIETTPASKEGTTKVASKDDDKGSYAFNNAKGAKSLYNDNEGEAKPSSTIPKTKTPVKGESKPDPSLNKPSEVSTGTGSNTDLGKYNNLNPVQAIKQAAKMVGVDENTMITFAKLESSLNPNAVNKTTKATGLFQITESTWNYLMKNHGSRLNIPTNAEKTNPLYNSLLAGTYMKESLNKLQNWREAGISQQAALYLAHFLGPAGANRFFKVAVSNPDAPMQNAVSARTYTANKDFMGGKTVRTFLSAINDKLAKAGGTPATAFAGASGGSSGGGASSGGGGSGGSGDGSAEASQPQQPRMIRTSSGSMMMRKDGSTDPGKMSDGSEPPKYNIGPMTEVNTAEDGSDKVTATSSSPVTNSTPAVNITKTNLNKPTTSSKPYGKEESTSSLTDVPLFKKMGISDGKFEVASVLPEAKKVMNMFRGEGSNSPTSTLKKMIDTSKMEGIMTNQLEALTKIATILTSIDGKFDPSKLSKLTEKTKEAEPAKPSTPKVDKSIPSDGIDLARKGSYSETPRVVYDI